MAGGHASGALIISSVTLSTWLPVQLIWRNRVAQATHCRPSAHASSSDSFGFTFGMHCGQDGSDNVDGLEDALAKAGGADVAFADCLPVRLAAKNGCMDADLAGRGTFWSTVLRLATVSSSLSNVRSIEDDAWYDDATWVVDDDDVDAEGLAEAAAAFVEPAHKLGSAHR